MEHDLIVVGGGIAGSCLAARVARAGARVLVLEREEAFRDRVRGEGMHPWGVAELSALGMLEPIVQSCGRELPSWQTYAGPVGNERDLRATTPARAGELVFHHPEMQEVALREAAAAGAEVIRGATAGEVLPGVPPRVRFERGGAERVLPARLVVVASGRGGRLPEVPEFARTQAPELLTVAGLLLEGGEPAPDAVRLAIGEGFDRGCIYFPLPSAGGPGGRTRAYVIHQSRERLGLSGRARGEAFIAQLRAIDPEPGRLEGVRAAGPLASFEGAPRWVCSPHCSGVALIGDAAGTVDPTFGCGLSMAVRDARVLAEALEARADWQAAAERYAHERVQRHRRQLCIEAWMRTILFTPGAEADALRAHALPRMQHAPDLVGMGPDAPTDDATRAALFGPAAASVPEV